MRGGVLALLLGFIMAVPAHAQSFEIAMSCYDATVNQFASDSAVEQCTRAIESKGLNDKNLATAYYNRALNLQELGRVELAIADYTEAIRLDRTNPFAFYNRGLALARSGRADAAVTDIITQWKIAPSQVKTDQTMLEKKGYYKGGVDGLAGPGTRKALEAWVADKAP
jgi:tetratricopeptide (TPR) repeat protein